MPEAISVKALAATTLSQDKHRTFTHFFADEEGEGLTITIAGGRPFTIVAGGSWEPTVGIMTSMEITGDGTMVIT